MYCCLPDARLIGKTMQSGQIGQSGNQAIRANRAKYGCPGVVSPKAIAPEVFLPNFLYQIVPETRFDIKKFRSKNNYLRGRINKGEISRFLDCSQEKRLVFPHKHSPERKVIDCFQLFYILLMISTHLI